MNIFSPGLALALSALIATADAGTLAVKISGLPTTVRPRVEVTGPDGFRATVRTTQAIAGLAAGDYVVSAPNVLTGIAAYTPQPATQTVTIESGAKSNAPVSYQTTPLTLALQEVVTGLSSPLFLTAPAGDARLFLIERPGRIRIVENGVLLPTPFLDITARTTTDGERGLLSMAFHPDYVTNGFFFVYFTDPNGDIAIERFTVSADPNIANPTPTRVITIEHRSFGNHNGGLVMFGADGFLYLATGDGGGGGDPLGSGQNLNSLLGKLLRLDVSSLPYTIPPDNPFVGQSGADEIWAFGLRNPWRFAFGSSLLYIADVGQSRREEVNVVSADAGGVNYGWNRTEGIRCFPNGPCDKSGITLPALQYGHRQGCSIAGGFEYRGVAIPEIRGRYFYSDLCTGFLRSFMYRNGRAGERIEWTIPNVGLILSFGEDANGELYLLSINGSVYRIVRG